MLKTILSVIFVLICLALTVIVLLQEGKSQGLGAIGGMAETYWGKNKGRSMEGLLVKITKWLAIGFFCTSLVLAYADSHAGKREPLVGGGTTTDAPVVPVGSTGGDSGATDTAPANTIPVEPEAPAQPAAPSGQ